MTHDIFSFDRTTLSLLRYIKHHPGKTLSEISNGKTEKDDSTQNVKPSHKGKKRFINITNTFFMLKILYKEGYITIKSNFELASSGQWNDSIDDVNCEPLYITLKGNKLLDDRFDRYWMWLIPTTISIVALVCSLLK